MTDEFDRGLDARMRRLEAAVPVATASVGAAVERAKPRSQVAVGGGFFALVVVGLVVVAVAASLASGGASPVPTGSAIPSSPAGGQSPVVGSASDSDLRLTITSSKGSYSPGEAIDAFATMEYVGPERAIDIGSSLGMPGFGVQQLDGPHKVSPGYRQACKAYAFEAGVPVRFPFSKSGSPDADRLDAEFVRNYFNIIGNKPDPILRLPAGIWRIFVEAKYSVSGCSADPRVLTASITVTVSGSPSPSSTDLPTAAPDGLVADTARNWSFQRPTSWTSWQPNAFSPINDGPLLYLANYPLLPECATSWQAAPNPARSDGRACELPFTELPAGGLFVQFYSGRILQPMPSGGTPIVFDGDATRIDIQRLGQCGALTADEVLTAAIPFRGAPGMTNARVVACINGPNVEASEQAVRNFLASVRSAFEDSMYPEACATFDLSQRRCDYIVNWARQEAGLAVTDPAAIELLGDPACPLAQPGCSVARTTQFVVRVRVSPTGGEPSDHPVFCGILSDTSLLCTEQPRIRIITPTGNGYWDVPCSGEAPENACAAPLPSIDAAAAALAIPLTISRLVIAIDHVGDYSVDLGDLTLPNGVLTEAFVALADDQPAELLLNPGFVNLALRSQETGEIIDNAYTHGWHSGVERVAATLEFNVEWFEAGAELVVAEATVR